MNATCRLPGRAFRPAFPVGLPRRAVLFEDIARNLVVPHDLGMGTVLVVPPTPDPFRERFEQEAVKEPHIDHITSDLAAFLARCVLPVVPQEPAAP